MNQESQARRLVLDEIRKNRRRCENIARYVCDRLSDQELREILLKAAEDHDEHGDIKDMDFIFRFVPRQFESSPVSDEEGSKALHNAVDSAVHDRFRDQGITTYNSDWTHDGIRRILVCWYKQKPDVPEYLKDLPNIALRKSHYNPDNIRLEIGNEECGSKLYPLLASSLQHLQGRGGFGSVGFIGFLEDGNQTHRVLVTVGHTLDEQTAEDAFVLGPEADSQFEMPQTSQATQRRLDVMNHFQRRNRRPQFRYRWPRPRSCMDEICLVGTEGLSEMELNRFRFPKQIDCNAFFPEARRTRPEFAASFPALLHHKAVVGTLRSKIPFTVHKRGAKTGHTTGKVVEVEECKENYWQKAIIGTETDEVRAFRLEVEWLSLDEPFTDSGDSGSLVYAEHEDKIVPLGIHCGSDGEGRSYAWLLCSWCEELSNWLNADLVFDLRVRQDIS